MEKFYLRGILCLFLTVLFILPQKGFSQDCSTLTASYVVSESRCASTGSIQVNASGGSGNYQYKVSGPITINFTSSDLITGLGPGDYLVIVKDITTNCVFQEDIITVPGTYVDPGFTMTSTDITCPGVNNGMITVTSRTNGRAPFSYKIIAPSASGVGTISATGNFTGLSAGDYFVQLSDSCGAIQTRSTSILDYSWQINNHSESILGCDSIAVTINLKDSKNNVSPNAIFNAFSYGIVLTAGDTTWFSTNNFHAYIGGSHAATLVVKDACGNVKKVNWTNTAIPNVSATVAISNKACSTFTAKVNNQVNLTNPQFCLYNSSNVLVVCNNSGTFNLVPYGSYCIKITDNCYDTTITRCFAVAAAVPVVNAAVSISDRICASFTAEITGQSNFTNPQFCLYDVADALVSCNTSGSFDDIPYGSYCIKITDGCYDTTITRCFTEIPPPPSVDAAVTISAATCGQFTAAITGQVNINNANYCLYDNADVLIECNTTGVFSIATYGSYCIKIANDIACYDTTITRCFTASMPPPFLGANVVISNETCNSFTATLIDTANWNNPQFCLYDNASVLVGCNNTGVFDLLPYGDYCIEVTNSPGCYDTTMTRCFSAIPPVPDITTPVSISNQTCATFTATIAGQTNLSNPQYCLYTAAMVLIECNSTGVFDNVPYGDYCIDVVNDPLCYDTTITRCFAVAPALPEVGADIDISDRTCGSFTATVTGQVNVNNPQFCLYDSIDVLISCNTTGVFTAITNGNYCIKIQNDAACYDTLIVRCFSVTGPVPDVNNSVNISNKSCGTFTATVSGQINMSNEQYCLYNNADSLLACNATGVFTNVTYGSYCIKIQNDAACYDTLIIRCFAESGPAPDVNSNVSVSNTTCSGFTATVTGQQNLNNEQYCLYDNADVLVSCNTNGVFTNIAYGSYCIKIQNGAGCYDTLITRCFSRAATSIHVSLSAKKSCTLIGGTNIKASFSNGEPPYSVKLYSPADSLMLTVTTSSSSYTFNGVVGLSATLKYKIIVIDQCGNMDSATIAPVVSTLTRAITVTPKCPSGLWANGSSDIAMAITSNLSGNIFPTIIKKNGANVTINVSTTSGNTYHFLDLGPATYIFATYVDYCNKSVYDTVTVTPYTYPNLSKSAAYQCDNNSFSVGVAVSGGIGPFQYEIIGSSPAAPSIIAGPQSNPIFTINNGTSYSLIRLRAVDACFNAGLNDASVLPLANPVITADATCYYQNITLSVDTIANAIYKWYKRTYPTDSILVGSDPTYNIPFLLPDDTGRYMCKVIVNNGCLEKQASYDVTGYCGGVVPVSVVLNASRARGGNYMQWVNNDLVNTQSYILERSASSNTGFTTINRRVVDRTSGNGDENYLDPLPLAGNNYYRVKVVAHDNSFKYSNTVMIKNTRSGVAVYPNPVRSKLNVLFSSEVAGSYVIDITSMQGQKVFSKTYTNVHSQVINYPANIVTNKGVYLVTVTDTGTLEREVFKVVFE